MPATTAEIVAELHALPRYRRLEALALACRDALAVWERFRAGAEPLFYMEGVVGTRQQVDDTLPAQALADVDAWLRGAPVDPQPTHRRYFEPTIALRDEDLAFPDPIPYAYHAIHNVFLLAFGLPGVDESYEDVVLNQVVSAVDVAADEWARDWWTRAWDAWASAPAPRPLADPGFLRSVLLVLEGQRAEGIAEALELLEQRGPRVDDWVAAHPFALAPNTIAIRGDEVVMADRARAIDGTPRCVRFDARGGLWVAGDRSDRVGRCATIVIDPRGAVTEVQGNRDVLALGPHGEAVCSDGLVLGPRAGVLLGEVVGAAVDDTYLATHDGTLVRVWQWDGSWRHVVMQPALHAPIRYIALADRRLLIASTGHSYLYDLP